MALSVQDSSMTQSVVLCASSFVVCGTDATGDKGRGKPLCESSPSPNPGSARWGVAEGGWALTGSERDARFAIAVSVNGCRHH